MIMSDKQTVLETVYRHPVVEPVHGGGALYRDHAVRIHRATRLEGRQEQWHHRHNLLQIYDSNFIKEIPLLIIIC